MAFNHPWLAMFYAHLLMLWASHMGCIWIESCVVVFAVLRLSRSFHVTLHRTRLTFGACDHVTFELHIWWGGGGGQFKTSKRILQNLGNVRKRNDKFEKFTAIWILTRHVGNISLAKTLRKRFCLTTKRWLSPLTLLQQCLEHCPLATEDIKSAVFHQNHLHYKLSAIILSKRPTLSKNRIFLRIFGNFKQGHPTRI